MRTLNKTEITEVSGGDGFYDPTQQQPWEQNGPAGLTDIWDPSDPAFIGISAELIGGTWTTDGDGSVTGANVNVGFDLDGDGETDISVTADTSGDSGSLTALFENGTSVSLGVNANGTWTLGGVIKF